MVFSSSSTTPCFKTTRCRRLRVFLVFSFWLSSLYSQLFLMYYPSPSISIVHLCRTEVVPRVIKRRWMYCTMPYVWGITPVINTYTSARTQKHFRLVLFGLGLASGFAPGTECC